MSVDLRTLLGARPDAVDAADVQAQVIAPPSETVLQLDGWSRRRGERVAEEWKEQGAGEIAAHVAADAHGALFDPEPKFADRPEEKGRAAWWRQLMETPEYQSLHAQTCLDTTMAGLAAKAICDQWVQYVAEQPEPQDGDGEGGPEPGSDGESIEQTVGRIRSVGQALQQASQTVDAAKSLAAGLGLGSGDKLDAQALASAFEKLRNNAMLRRIMALAGRFRSRCQSLQKQKLNATRGEIAGVELAGDVGRLLAAERAQIAGVVPETEMLALYRLAQRRMLCYRHTQTKPVQAGPIVVVVDESASMGGDRIIAAKALAITMAWLARHQKRWCALVGFECGEVGNALCLPPEKPDQGDLFGWLEHFFNGGTTLDVPLATVPFDYWDKFVAQGMQRGKTDVIIITDGCVDCPTEMRDRYRAWAKAEKVKTLGVIIEAGEPGGLEGVCDRYWCLPDLSLENDAVEHILSL
jgi:uncharacterized protein with von Willebrand factor type A (vWA) domain